MRVSHTSVFRALKNRTAFFKYVVASCLSLGLDLTVFFLLLKSAVPAVIAASVSYTSGIALHWIISSRAVFTGSTSFDPAIRSLQKFLFIASALLGLAITSAIVALGQKLNASPAYAKAVAILVSFAITWALRRRIVFNEQFTSGAKHAGTTLRRKWKR